MEKTTTKPVLRKPTTFEKFLLPSLSCMTAAMFTNPIDIMKVRLQIQGELSASTEKKYKGLFRGMPVLVREEGFRALTLGLAPSLMREATYSGMRLGLYELMKSKIQERDGDTKKSLPLYKTVVIGVIAGTIASGIASPTDLMKVRMQGSTVNNQRYKGLFDAIRSIYREGGLKGFYVGVSANVPRAAVLCGSQMPFYDKSKSMLLEYKLMEQGLPLHFVASMMSGLGSAITTSPVDVVKSRFMNQKLDAKGKGLLYSNPIDCAVKTFKAEGISGFYKGFFPQWFRIGPQTVLTFVVLETLRSVVGISPIT